MPGVGRRSGIIDRPQLRDLLVALLLLAFFAQA